MATKVPWPVKTGDNESITFVWPGELGSETYRCEVRPEAGSTGTPLATCTVAAAGVGANVEVTVSLSSAQTRALAELSVAAYDLEQDAGGIISTLFEGPVQIRRDVTL